MQQWLKQLKSLLNTITTNRYSKIAFTVGLSAVGISVVASYYFDLFSNKNRKRILHKRKLIETVRIF